MVHLSFGAPFDDFQCFAHPNMFHSTIARALANDPEILLLDEPTGDLDTYNTVEVMDLLLRINHERQTTWYTRE